MNGKYVKWTGNGNTGMIVKIVDEDFNRGMLVKPGHNSSKEFVKDNLNKITNGWERFYSERWELVKSYNSPLWKVMNE